MTAVPVRMSAAINVNGNALFVIKGDGRGLAQKDALLAVWAAPSSPSTATVRSRRTGVIIRGMFPPVTGRVAACAVFAVRWHPCPSPGSGLAVRVGGLVQKGVQSHLTAEKSEQSAPGRQSPR